MKIFTRVFLGILALGLVVGSKAASLGVVPGGLPVNARVADTSKSDTVFLNWRSASGLTVTDLGILPALNFPSYNPNAKKYSPFLYLTKKGNSALAVKPGVRNVTPSYTAVTRQLSSTQGIKESKLIPSLNAYPNPSRGVTKISLSSLGDDHYKIRISNAIGKVYKEIPVMQPSATETIVVDLSPLPAGIYFYSLLVNEKMVETKRLILQPQ
ncbi:T9SS C-terminal target domain-containing protein [Rufibacter immobilis]|uniref:T9SS C-terminal target domain-containing protein n=1 Tax=Rufibacter immobilis TaxID=1348778 RepID=A0A3M9MZ35_9BACT|nr:T9SS type A sorting domain-containing protein [Rufibacter immobilis]RNI30811.1 T9SS C-terminal target domain-containing protein [Rufibacter immobilis]